MVEVASSHDSGIRQMEAISRCRDPTGCIRFILDPQKFYLRSSRPLLRPAAD